MAWVRIDDGVPHHRKFLQAGPAACWLWVCAVAYSQRQLTDGIVSREAVPTLGVASPKKLLDKLVTVGLLDVHTLGWKVHDYLDHNDSRDVALAKKATMSAARSDAGKRGMASRWQSDNKQDNKPDNKPITRWDNKPITPSHPIPSGTKETSSPPVIDHPIKAFLRLHNELFREKFGQDPGPYGGADAKVAKDVISHKGEDDARALLREFFVSADPFIEQSGYGITVFRGQINKLVAQRAKLLTPADRQMARNSAHYRGNNGTPLPLERK